MEEATVGAIGEVSAYISKGGEAELPPQVVEVAKHHILDTLAAIVSGSVLKGGQVAKQFVSKQPPSDEAQVVGSDTTSAINAALAHGVMAHSDETDDSHSRLLIHPGCAVVPAALAMSERQSASGMRFLKSVVVGYDIGARVTDALGMDKKKSRSFPTGVGATFGAASAAAAVLGLEEGLIKYVMSYAAQQSSGVSSFFSEDEHVEKGFVFGGMPARNGVTAAILVESGFTGAKDVFGGEHNMLAILSANSDERKLVEGLGTRFDITLTNIKKYSVGLSIQAPVDGLLTLIDRHHLTAGDVQSVVVRMPGYGVHTIGKGAMTNITLLHILAVALHDGKLTFEAVHSRERANNPAVLQLKDRIQWVEDPELTASKVMRQAIVEVTTNDGSKLREHVTGVRGTPQNPMTKEEVENKARNLVTPVLGKQRSQKLIETIWNLVQVKDVRELRPLLCAN